MGSGYFPISKTSEHGKRLLEMSLEIQKIEEWVYANSMANTQTDDAMTDGMACAELNLAVELIHRNIK